MSGLYHIQEFKPSTIKPYTTWLILGARGSGKSTLLENLLFHVRDHVDLPVGMTPTIGTIEMFERHMPGRLVHHSYNYDVADSFLVELKQLADKNKTRKVGFFNDDCMFDSKVMKTQTQRFLHLNGRHYKVTEFTICQYLMIIPSVIRGNIDYVVSLKEPSKDNKMKLYKYFFGCFPTFKEFDRVFSSVTENYGCIIMDRTQASNGVSDCIYHYRAPLQTPPFKMGKRVYYILDEALERAAQRQRQRRGNTKAV